MQDIPLPAPRQLDDQRVVALLRAGIPLSLLLDLAQPDPMSQDLYEHEHAS
jgi:hypothetical protein